MSVRGSASRARRWLLAAAPCPPRSDAPSLSPFPPQATSGGPTTPAAPPARATFRRRADQQVERRQARRGVDVSVRRDRLQPHRRRAASSTAGAATAPSSRWTQGRARKSGSARRCRRMSARGMNYWESKDGKDRRLIFSVNDYLQEIDAATGQPVFTIRQGRRRRSPRGARARSRHDRTHPVRHAGQGVREPDPARIGHRRSLHVAAGRSPRVRRAHRQAGVAVPHRAAPRRVRLRDVAEGCLQVHRRHEHVGEITVDAERGIAYFPTGSPTYDYYGADRPGANLFGNFAARARRAHRQAALALPDGAPRSLGLRRQRRAAADDDQAQRQERRRRRDGRQDRLPLRVRPRHRRADLADRGAAGAEERDARRTVVADAALPDESAALQQAVVHRGRHQSASRSSRPRRARQFKQRLAKTRNLGLFTPIDFTDTLHIPGSNGGALFGYTATEPATGMVYVISQDNPGVLRLLKAGEMPPTGRPA